MIKPDLVLLANNVMIETFCTGRQIIDDKVIVVDQQMGRVDQDHKWYDIIPVADLNYDEDWRQMMPAVSKIFLIAEYNKGSKIDDLAKKVREAYLTTEISKVFPEVVTFVEYYNKRKNG